MSQRFLKTKFTVRLKIRQAAKKVCNAAYSLCIDGLIAREFARIDVEDSVQSGRMATTF